MAHLHPIERRVVALTQEGESADEIAVRFRRSPDFIRRVFALAQVSRPEGDRREPGSLRPLERRLLRWREEGASVDEIAARFRRSSDHVERVLDLTDLKLRRSAAASE